MPATHSITPQVAQDMIGGTKSYAESLGASPKIRIYDGTPPANAAAALSGNNLLAELVASATPIASTTSTGTAGRAIWNPIASSIAGASGHASFVRTYNGDGVTPVDQSNVGTTDSALNLSTLDITAGSTVSISSRTSDQPTGP